MRGKPPEEIHGVISWQMRQVLSALAAGSAEEAGMKPYTYSKAKAALKKYSREELQGIADSLLKMNHDARRGITNLPAALEHLALTI